MKHKHAGAEDEYCTNCLREVGKEVARREMFSRIAGSVLLLAFAVSTIILAIHYARGIR